MLLLSVVNSFVVLVFCCAEHGSVYALLVLIIEVLGYLVWVVEEYLRYGHFIIEALAILFGDGVLMSYNVYIGFYVLLYWQSRIFYY